MWYWDIDLQEWVDLDPPPQMSFAERQRATFKAAFEEMDEERKRRAIENVRSGRQRLYGPR